MKNVEDKKFDAIIIGAGAAGLMCAITAAKNGCHVAVIDHANKVGKKILLSGGGRCNFTNLYTSPANYLSANPHFCISALKRYTTADYIAMVEAHHIAYHEKTLGQLFCDVSSKEIVRMLMEQIEALGVPIFLKHEVKSITYDKMYTIEASGSQFAAHKLVIATGGLSFPTMGASPFGYRIAEQFGHQIIPVRAGLVPLTLQPKELSLFSALAGVAVDVVITAACGQQFKEALLFTHRGLSGPAILQISSYWQPGESIVINFLPEQRIEEVLDQAMIHQRNAMLKTILNQYLPQRLVGLLCTSYLTNKPLKQLQQAELDQLAQILHNFALVPSGTEGYRTAEVTLGGVDVNQVSSKTFASKHQEGLYFIGEVLDVTGHLGGFNFQWAWASGYCCGLALVQ